MSDPGLYRTKDEIEEWKKRDPLTTARLKLDQIKVPEAELAALEEKVRAEVEDAVKFSDESPELPFERLPEFVYKE